MIFITWFIWVFSLNCMAEYDTKKVNQALRQALQALTEETEVGGGHDRCAGKTDEWAKSCANINTETHCSSGIYQRKCAKTCCVSNKGCSHSSCSDCVSANDDGARTCDWVEGACTEVPAGTHWKSLKVSATYNCPSALGLETAVSGLSSACGADDFGCKSYCRPGGEGHECCPSENVFTNPDWTYSCCDGPLSWDSGSPKCLPGVAVGGYRRVQVSEPCGTFEGAYCGSSNGYCCPSGLSCDSSAYTCIRRTEEAGSGVAVGGCEEDQELCYIMLESFDCTDDIHSMNEDMFRVGYLLKDYCPCMCVEARVAQMGQAAIAKRAAALARSKAKAATGKRATKN